MPDDANPLESDLFFDLAFDLLAVVGGDGYFKRVNPAFERTLGYTPAELMAKPLHQFLHPEDVEKTKAGIQKLMDGALRIDSVNRYLCKNGEYKWFSWDTVPRGDLMYTVGRDISEQVAMQDLIRKISASLAAKNEALEAEIQLQNMGELPK